MAPEQLLFEEIDVSHYARLLQLQHKHVIFASRRRRIRNTNTFVTNYSLEQSLFISVYSGTLDPYFHRAVISSLALDVEYFFLNHYFFYHNLPTNHPDSYQTIKPSWYE